VPNDYRVLVTDGNGCKGADTVNVVFKLAPIVILPEDTTLCVQKTPLALSVPNGFISILWSTQETTATVNIKKPGQVWVQVTNMFSCSDSDTMSITEVCDPIEICFPNVMTPNSDSHNDVFKPCVDDYLTIDNPEYAWYLQNIKWEQFEVYDRWGIKMFESNGDMPLWDGKFNGNNVADGTYFWIANYSDTFLKKSFTVTGWVQVIE
jgi:gliding motility-associated-like protein